MAYSKALSVNNFRNNNEIHSSTDLQKSFEIDKNGVRRPVTQIKGANTFVEDDFGCGENGDQSYISIDIDDECNGENSE